MQCWRRELPKRVQVLFSTSTCPLRLVCKSVRLLPLLPFIIHPKQVASLLHGLCNFCSQVLIPSINHENVANPSMRCYTLTWFGKQSLVLCIALKIIDAIAFHLQQNPSSWSFSCSKPRHTLGVCRCPQGSGHSRPS